MTRDAAIAAIRASSLAPHADALISLLAPCAHLVSRRVAPDAIAPGASRLGGKPDLPVGFRWPMRGSRPLDFLAQIALADAARAGLSPPLPAAGWLVVFYDAQEQPWGIWPGDRDAWSVARFDGEPGALRRTPPPGSPEPRPGFWARLWRRQRPRPEFAPCALEVRASVSLPSDGDEVHQPTVDLTDDATAEAYIGLVEAVNGSERTSHRLLGHADTIQGEWRRDGVHFATGECDIPDWRLLLQIDTDETGPGWMWGDGGRVYVGIREADLRAGTFAACGLTLQCY